MSFLDYLKEHRGEYIDHRVIPPTTLSPSAAEVELDLEPGSDAGQASRLRRRRSRTAPRASIRFRHVRPAFAPSPYSDPLPYEETWERAFR